ncbi:MAG: hypothetical protein C0614_10560 [Desulfuromonas sp.]|mgnify:CR=1 FL=1|nr:MAG: hypothetical protein C0614_10560 [Desulfuromonas sp.]
MADTQPSPTIDADLARRLHRALLASSEELFQIIQDPAMEVLNNALKNRHLHEDHLKALLKRRDLRENLLKAVYHHDHLKRSHALRLALVKNPTTPGPIVLTILPQLHLFELVNLCFMPGITPDQKYAVERAIVQRLPTTELGNRMTLARRATATVVGEILKSGEIQLVEICLNNPRLREVTILQFLNGANSTAETISMVARHSKWKTRPNLRMAILKNRRTPAVWFTLFLPSLRTTDIRSLLASRRLNPNQKKLTEGELAKRGK